MFALGKQPLQQSIVIRESEAVRAGVAETLHESYKLPLLKTPISLAQVMGGGRTLDAPNIQDLLHRP